MVASTSPGDDSLGIVAGFVSHDSRGIVDGFWSRDVRPADGVAGTPPLDLLTMVVMIMLALLVSDDGSDDDSDDDSVNNNDDDSDDDSVNNNDNDSDDDSDGKPALSRHWGKRLRVSARPRWRLRSSSLPAHLDTEDHKLQGLNRGIISSRFFSLSPTSLGSCFSWSTMAPLHSRLSSSPIEDIEVN